MEKVEKLDKPSDEELKKLEYIPAGNRLAAKYLKEEDYNLAAELNKYKDAGIKIHIIQGAEEIFLRNIILPRNDEGSRGERRRALPGGNAGRRREVRPTGTARYHPGRSQVPGLGPSRRGVVRDGGGPTAG